MKPCNYKQVSAFTVTLAVAVNACRDEPDLPPIIWEGEHIRFGTFADDSELCAGTLPYLDGSAGHLAKVFRRNGSRVDYYWLPKDGPGEYCENDWSEGCVDDRGNIFTQYAIHQHELVHAIRFPDWLYLPFEEGLAETHGDDWERFPIQGDIRTLLEDPGENGYIPGPGYGLAGHFLSYLEANYGLNEIFALDAATDYEDSFTQAEAAFSSTYGVSLDEVIEAYETEYPRCDSRVFRDNSFDCSRNIVSAPTNLDTRLEMIVSMACDDPNVLGPRLGHRWASVTLDVEVEGKYQLGIAPTESTSLELIRITRCDISCYEYPDDLPSRTTGDQLGGQHCLRPGRYLFRLSIDEELDENYEFDVTLRTIESCD